LNPYFWFFAIYAVLITPFTIHGSVRLEKTLRWKIQLRLAGLPLLHTGKGGEAQKTADVLASADVRLLAALLKDGSIRRFVSVFKMERFDIYARLSLNDAALTATLYALLRTVLQTLAVCGALTRTVNGRVEVDFESRGSQMALDGIFACRLGSLGLAAIRLGMAMARQKRLSAEEEAYAAASH